MLRRLFIKDFILIDSLDIEFGEGFNVFTGETGAGKSIIVDAISYLTGVRADKNVVRNGKDKTIIEGVFDMNEHQRHLLEENGLDYDDYLTITREINKENKSIIRVNGRMSTLSFVADLFETYVDIHSQRDNQYLLKAKNHLALLDKYAKNEEILVTLKEKYKIYKALKDELEEALVSKYNEKDLDLFEFELQEIEDANLKNGEEDELLDLERKSKSSLKILESLNAAIDIYNKDEGLDTMFYEFIKNIDIGEEDFEEVVSSANDAYYTLQSVFDSVNKYMKTLDFDEETINNIEERLFTINKLKRKYGNTIAQIDSYKEDLINKINYIKNRESYLEEMNKKIDIAYKDYRKVADEVSKIRHSISSELSNKIKKELDELNLPNSVFVIDIKDGNDSSLGYDSAEFLVSMNKGNAPSPLIKVASGGEISRLMLGLKVVFAKLIGLETIIFDEIDVGVSGIAATLIGRKMKELSTEVQVYSITHSAQVAALADNHYFVSKKDLDDHTTSKIELLDDNRRLEELAMIQSSIVNEKTLAAAKELLNNEIK